MSRRYDKIAIKCNGIYSRVGVQWKNKEKKRTKKRKRKEKRQRVKHEGK